MADYWAALDALVAGSKIRIDRPQGSRHPRFGFVYPLDYGYLEHTTGGDGHGVDVWIGGNPERCVTGVFCTVDPYKRDAETKVLWGVSPREAQLLIDFYRPQPQAALLVMRD
jgi:inorganic pyrophosphatase